VLIIVADQLSNASDIADNIRKNLYQGLTGESLMPSFLNVESTSAGEMFLGAIIPGLILVFLYAAYVLIHAIFIKNSAPAIPNKKGFDKEFWIKVSSTLIPPVLLIFIVLGSILFGVTTVNQAGAIGALGSTVMASYKLHPNKKHTYTPTIIATISSIGILILHFSLNLNIKNITNNYQLTGIVVSTLFVIALVISLIWSFWRVYKTEDILKYVTTETALTTTMVFIILIGAAMLTAAFRGFGGDEVITNFLKDLPGGFWTQFWVVMFIIFILGFFIDYIEIAVIVVPIIAPILLANPEANVTALWFGVMVGVNMQTSFLTPPFGFSLFYLRGVAPPSITTLDIWKGAVPFICLQLIGLFITCYWPSLSNYIPTRSYLTSELSPPPTNPRLERCLIDYTFNLYDKDGAKIKIAIDNAKKLNLDSLPDSKKEILNDHFTKSLIALDLVKNAQEKKKILDTFSKDYYDIHIAARKNQSKILDINKKIIEIEKDIKQAKSEKKISELKEKIQNYKNEIIKLEKLVPKEFVEKNKKYKELYNDYKKSLNTYYLSVDSYANFKQLKKNLQDVENLKTEQANLKESINEIKANNFDKLLKLLNDVMYRLDKISGTNEIKDTIYSVIADIQKGNNDRQITNEKINESLNLINKEIKWREKPAKILLPYLEKYDDEIKDTIGIRQQDKLPKKQALHIAKCESGHHNISLHF
jgi:TRAP-type mannitol/chloroaromatic compound transport system permease large subunit